MPLRRIIGIGLTLAAGIAASGAIAAPAIALPAISRNNGIFDSWPQAQRDAGFALEQPGSTYGLKSVGHIVVTACGSKRGKHMVAVNYATRTHATFGLVQDNADGPCVSGYTASSLGRYKIHGVTARLYGFCDVVAAPSCSKKDVALWLAWQQRSTYYVASAYDESRARLLRFARDLKRV
jgi:hypothetical protein